MEEDAGAAAATADTAVEMTADMAEEMGTLEKAGYSGAGGGYSDVTDKKAYNECV